MATTSKLSAVVLLVAVALTGCGLAFGASTAPETTVAEADGAVSDRSTPLVTAPGSSTTSSITTLPINPSDLEYMMPVGQSPLCVAADELGVVATRLANVGNPDSYAWAEVLTEAQQSEGVRLLGEFRVKAEALVQEMEMSGLLDDPDGLRSLMARTDEIDQTKDIRNGFLTFIRQRQSEFVPLSWMLIDTCPDNLLTHLILTAE